MRKLSILLLILLVSLNVLPINADENFRRHRYDVLDSLPPAPQGSIIFLGNSITHMMEWQELFGDRQDIFNRGVSGAHTYEVLQHLQYLLGEGPSKVFLMIGTNDLGDPGDENNPERVADRIISIILRILELHPETTVYYQSILPTGKRWRGPEKTIITNNIVKNWIEKRNLDNVLYVDLYSAFADENGEIIDTDENGTDTCLSLDGLHLSWKGYEIWAELIKEYVGSDPQVNQHSVNLFGDLAKSPAMRTSYFGGLPIKNSDILLFGDEMIHTGEWNELTGGKNLKDRGIGWGFPGIRLNKFNTVFKHTLRGNTENGLIKETPAGVIFYAGASDVLVSDDIKDVIKDYKQTIDSLRSLLPDSPIFLMTLAPFPVSYGEKSNSLALLNESIRNFSNLPGFYLIDVEQCLREGRETTDRDTSKEKIAAERNESYFMDKDDFYINGKGYRIIADKIKEVVLGNFR